jgi:uncharacterized protein
MIFNVAGLLKEKSGAVRRHRLEGERLQSEEHGSFEDISGPVTLMRTDRTVSVSASLEASATRACSRCLESARVELQAYIEEEFHPVNKDLGGVRRDSSRDDDPLDPVLLIDDRNNLDLTEVAQQSLAGVTPIAPLCRPDCRGLCPVCSKNRNKTPCNCQQQASGPRWEGLADWGQLRQTARMDRAVQ